MKKCMYLLLSFVIFIGLSACGKGKDNNSENKINVVCTTFAAYDWTCNILEGLSGYEVSYLTDSGVDIHSYNPSVADAAAIITADLLVYIGGPSDQWVYEIISNNDNAKRHSLSLLDMLSDKIVEEEIVEGMVSKEEEDSDEVEYDEHVWLSLSNASVCVDKIAAELSCINPSDKETLSKNASLYQEKLTALDEEYRKVTDMAGNKTIVVCDRFPFRYLFDDYGLDYYAAFPGCSAESEAGFDTIVFLSGKINEMGLDYVSILEKTTNDISKAVISNCDNKNIQVLSLNSMQSVSLKDARAGEDYLYIAKQNLEALKKLCQ